MRLLIVSHTIHYQKDNALYAYGPYVREMNLWLEGVSEAEVVAPLSDSRPEDIHLPYSPGKVSIKKIPSISLTSPLQLLRTLVLIPVIYFKIVGAMRRADHIHLRCPGNIGLLGCLAQVWFPTKPKTAKYAGNWDPASKQPLSYRFQKWLLSNSFLSRKMQVLVYGDWKDQSKNVKPFFTASYSKSKITETAEREFGSTVRILFVGSLAPGKRPLYAAQLVEQLISRGMDCRLDMYGDGSERPRLETYIEDNRLSEFITLHGNVAAPVVEYAYKNSHILLLPSKSEGWPKVVAEAMFWGVVPAVTSISCVDWMLDGGKRGILLSTQLDADVSELIDHLTKPGRLKSLSVEGQRWSHQYTLDSFKGAIRELL